MPPSEKRAIGVELQVLTPGVLEYLFRGRPPLQIRWIECVAVLYKRTRDEHGQQELQ